MFIRLLFWTAEKPNPRVIATGTGKTLEGAMAGCFAPIGDKTWKREYRDGKLFLRRGGTGYCGEIVNHDEIDVSVKQPVRSMRTVKKADGWWVTGIPDCYDCGPYKTKDDAEEHRRGLQRTYDNIDDPTFFTGEKLPKARQRLAAKPRQRLSLTPARQRLKL